MSDGKVIYEVRADDSKLDSDLDGANQKVEKGSGKLAKTAVAASATIAIAATTAAVKFGTEFEDSFAKASTLFGDVEVDVDNLQSKILELSTESGVAATELNEGLYSALSAGVPITEDSAEALAFLESSAKLAKAGFTDVDTAISATAKTLNAYGMDVSEAERIQNLLITTQNMGEVTPLMLEIA
jgi:TP901 family phage tail tape measure protein